MAQFTKTAIMDAFGRLLEQTPLDHITVQGIIALCGISRNTFYYHYGDIYALLEAFLRRDMDRLRANHREGEGWYEDIRRIVTYAMENRRRVFHIYHSVNHQLLLQYFSSITEELFMEYIREQAGDLPVAEEDIRFICLSYQSLFVGLLVNWLDQGMKSDPHKFLDQARRLLTGNTRRILEVSLRDP